MDRTRGVPTSVRQARRSRRFGRSKARLLTAVAVLAVALTALPGGVRPASATTNGCIPAILYFTRGSGESAGLGGVGSALLSALRTSTQNRVGAVPNPYPAESVLAPDAFIGGQYVASVGDGITQFVDDVTSLSQRCSASAIIVAGYSQGAEVTRYGLTLLTNTVRAHVKAVALFGDPWFVPTEQNTIKLGGFSPNYKGVHYTLGVGAYPLLPRAMPPDLAGRSFSFCHAQDIVCQFTGYSWTGPHFTYDRLGAPEAAGLVTPLLGLPSAGSPSSVPPASPVSICEAFVADVTVPDGSVIAAGSAFSKSWRLHNCGTSPWTGVHAQLLSGNTGPASFAVPALAAGATGTISVPLTAPTAPGHYHANYRLVSPSGAVGNNAFWVDFNVAAPRYDCEAFIADLSVPDGSSVLPGAGFTKTWRLRNCGTTNWSGLQAVRVAGSYGPEAFFVSAVAPGATADVSVPMSAPSTSGLQRATYRLRAADGHYAANSFWVEVNVTGQSALSPARSAVASYDRMAPGAPHHGYYDTAWQGFTAMTDRITELAATVGNPALPAGEAVAAHLTLRLCSDPGCSTVLAAAEPQIVNYGATAAEIGDVPVTRGQMYYVAWTQPSPVNGFPWVTYWWAGGSTISTSDQMQATVRGYQTHLLGDLNNDGYAGCADKDIILAHWQMQPATAADGDLDGDGTVNVLDLSALLAEWAPAPGDSC